VWEIEFTGEFEQWWIGLEEKVQDAIDKLVQVLRNSGPSLGRPRVDTVKGSRHSHMKELRVQSGGEPYRIFFAFDPRRVGILLIGGCKAGDPRFYDRIIPIADDLYDQYIREITKEGLL
jgi:hypothetical protein